MSLFEADGATYDDKGRLLIHTHDSLSNRDSGDIENQPTLYIVGDADTDGSIRILFDTTENTISNFELRTNGVFNDTGVRIASSSLSIGRDMTLSAVAGHLETFNPSAVVGHTKGLIPHILFTDAGTAGLETPIVKAEEIFTVFGTAVSETIGTTISINIGTTPGRIIEESIHEVGTVGSSEPVTVKFFVGSDNTGFLFNKKILPATALVANTTLEINYDNDLGFDENTAIFQEFTSDANFSLKTDSGGNPLTKHEAHELQEIGVLSENLMLDENLNLMFDTSLNPMFAIQFP